MTKTIQEQLVSQVARLRTKARRQINRDVRPKRPRNHVLGEKPAFQSPVVIASTRRDKLGTENTESTRIKLSLSVHHRAQNRHTAYVAVIQNLDDFRLFVAEPKVSFVEDKGSAEGVKNVKYRRNAGGPAGKESFVADRTKGHERARLAASPVTAQTKVGHFIKSVI